MIESDSSLRQTVRLSVATNFFETIRLSQLGLASMSAASPTGNFTALSDR